MKKASFVSLVLMVLAANSLVLAQPAKVLLLEPETERVQFSIACDVYAWMGEVFGNCKSYLELVDLKKSRDTLAGRNMYLSHCKVNEDYFKVGDILNIDKIVYTKLVSTDPKFTYAATVYDIKTKAVIFQKETSTDNVYKNDIYNLVLRATKELTDSIYNYDTKNDTTIYAGKAEFRAMERTPEIVKKVPARYPNQAKVLGIQGKVILYLLIDIDGRVKRVDIAISSGSALLDEAAKEAASQCIFTPAIAPGNKPVRVWVMYPINFKLE